MTNIYNIQKSLKEIITRLAADVELQKLLLIDNPSVSDTLFTPLSLNEMLQQSYICLMPQNEVGIQNMGRNNLIVVLLNSIEFDHESNSANVEATISVLINMNNIMINNYEDRGLAISGRIVQCLENLKLSTSAAITIDYINRVSYSSTIYGYQLNIRFEDQLYKKVEL